MTFQSVLFAITCVAALIVLYSFLHDGPREREPWEIERDKRDLWQHCQGHLYRAALRNKYQDMPLEEFESRISLRETADGQCIFSFDMHDLYESA